MRKILITVIVFLSFSSIDWAQTKSDEIKEYNMGEVVVTANEECVVRSASITDILFNLIDKTSNVDITSSLELIPGLKISSTSKNESKIYMRGYDQRQISIFLDGVPIYEPYSGFIDLSNIPVVSIEKVTVSKGMPSILYGPNSMAGSINFVTKHGEEKSYGEFNIERGFGTNISAGLSGELGFFDYAISAGYYTSSGFYIPEPIKNAVNEDGEKRDNSDFDKFGAMIKIGFNPFHNFDIDYSFMYVDNEKGIPTDIYTAKEKYWRYTEWKKNVHNIMMRTFIGSSFSMRANMFYENYDNVLDSYDDNTYTTQLNRSSFHSVYDDHSYGTNIGASLMTFLPGLTRFAFQYKRDVHKESGNFNEPFAEYKAETVSAGIEQELNPIDNIGMVTGVSYDNLRPVYADGNRLRTSTSVVNGHAGLYYTLTCQINLHANLSKKSRFPTLKEFYTETLGRDVANPDLKVEKSINTEIGALYKLANSFTCELNLFYNNVENLINLVYLDDGLRQYQNIGKAEFKGVELSSVFREDNLNMILNYTYLNSSNKSEERESDHLEYRPEHVITLIPSYMFDIGLFVRGELTYIGGRHGVDSNSYEITSMENYMIMSLYTSQTFMNKYTIYFRINNLLDKYYEEEFGFPQPGRELFTGLKIEW